MSGMRRGTSRASARRKSVRIGSMSGSRFQSGSDDSTSVAPSRSASTVLISLAAAATIGASVFESGEYTIIDVPTVTGRARIVGDVASASGVGATITIGASGNILLKGNGSTGARISSNQTGSCAGGGGGDITLTAAATIITEKGSIITSTSACPAGEIILNAGLSASIAGIVSSEGTSTIGRGGPVTVTGSCNLTIEDSGQVISKGRDPGADLVHLEGGCAVLIEGLVASTAPGHTTPTLNRCHAPDRPDKPADAPACVEVWSGGPLTIDKATHNGEVSADSGQSGGVNCCAWIDLFAQGDIKITGSATTAVFAVHANQFLTNGFGGFITVTSTQGRVTASGRAIQASDTVGGGHAGNVTIEAKLDVTLDESVILAQGDFVPTYGFGGFMEIRSFTGALKWLDIPGALVATGDVQPTGLGVLAAKRGAIDLRACVAVTTTGTLFPMTSGGASGPTTTAGLCPPAEPAGPTLPDYVTLPSCTCQPTKPDVSVLKSTTTPSVKVGDAVSYSIVVTAGGTGESNNVVLTDVVPAGVTWTVGGADASVCSPLPVVSGGATLTCKFGTMAPGESKTITLTGQASAANCPSMANTAVVTADGDTSPGNNSSGPIPIAVTCKPDVSVIKTTSTPKISAGGIAKYSITVTAGGTGNSENVKLTDVLPTGLTWTVGGDTATCSPSSPVPGGTTLTCNFGTMAAGTSKTITLSANTTGAHFAGLMLATYDDYHNPPAPKCVTLSNTATVTSSNDSNSLNNSSGPIIIAIDCKPDVSVSKKASDSKIKPGDTAKYSITVTAGGTGSSTNVKLTDVLPAGFTWKIGGSDASFCTPASPVVGGATLTCNFGTMAQGATRTITLEAATGSVACGTTISNTAVVSADVDTYSSNSISGPVKIAVLCPDVKVIKTTSTPKIKPGDYAKYAITVIANGPSSSTNVKLTDVLPSGLTWTVSGDTAGCSPTSPVAGGTTLTCDFGTMAEGTSKTIYLSAKTPWSYHDSPDDIYNTAQVTATKDGFTSNNKSGPIKIDVVKYYY